MNGQQLKKNKQVAISSFLKALSQSPLKGDIFKVLLFGSLIYGDWNKDSDIDILVFSKNKNKQIENFLSKVSYDILLEQGELIEPLVYKISDWQRPRSSFLLEAIKDGQELKLSNI